GVTTIAFEDDASDLQNWNPGNWGITSSSFISAPSSISDSPFGNYPNNANNMITLTPAVTIPETSYANLSFWAKWDIEAGWDYVQLLLKPSGAFSWTPLEGKYTKAGGSNQLPGQPLYDGTSAWVKEEIDLTAYAGNEIQLRFQLVSDGSVNGDGFFFDDIKIIVL
ncbi:immune inhibitor A, partial [Arthrospira platensis SPKY1]|nr:immune inhibitor A [Arthrospira platensis SPKY1]